MGWSTGLLNAHALSLSGKPGSFVDVPEPGVDTTRSYTKVDLTRLRAVADFDIGGLL